MVEWHLSEWQWRSSAVLAAGYSFAAVTAIAAYAAVVRSTQAPVTKSGKATP